MEWFEEIRQYVSDSREEQVPREPEYEREPEPMVHTELEQVSEEREEYRPLSDWSPDEAQFTELSFPEVQDDRQKIEFKDPAAQTEVLDITVTPDDFSPSDTYGQSYDNLMLGNRDRD